MLGFFPKLYPDEVLYSIFSRYHNMSGDKSIKRSVIDLFGKRVFTHISDFPIYINDLCNQFPNKNQYTPEHFIYNHTTFPLYSVFFPEKRALKHIEQMKMGNTCDIRMKLENKSQNFVKKQSVKFCFKCVEEDRQKFGEAYLHRIHQVDGNNICHIHDELLQKFIKPDNLGKWDLINIENYISKDNYISLKETIKEETKNKMKDLAKDIVFVLTKYDEFPKFEESYKRYRIALLKKGYIGTKGRINQKKIISDFLNFYSEEYLNLLYSNIDICSKSNWIRSITTEIYYNEMIHPIRHLLMIRFLFGEMENFIKARNHDYYPFGKGPWPCLNPVADHYMKDTIYEYKLAQHSTAAKPIGVFECSCGYIYARRGPDKNDSDRYNKMSILQYGYVWKKVLKHYLETEDYSITKLAKLMKCATNTIKRHIDELNSGGVINNENNRKFGGRTYNKELEKPYKKKIINYLKQNINATRSQVNKECKREYQWLYNNHREFLDGILPPPNKKSDLVSRGVDWETRDNELSSIVNKAVEEIKSEKKLRRIIIGAIGRKIGYAQLNRFLENLPKTKSEVNKYIESLEDYRKRRIRFVIKQMKEKNIRVKRWKVIQEAHLNKYLTEEIERYIDKIIKQND